MPADFANRVRVRLHEMFVEAGRCPSKAAIAADLGCCVSTSRKAGGCMYRDRMSPAWRRRAADEAHEMFQSLGLTSDFWRFS